MSTDQGISITVEEKSLGPLLYFQSDVDPAYQKSTCGCKHVGCMMNI